MKKLVLNALSALRGGGQTNIINLLIYLPQYECEVIVVVNSKNRDVFTKYESKQIKIYEAKNASKSLLHRIFWEKYILPLKLKDWNTDIYYAPGGILITVVPDNCVGVTTLQNMLPFDDIERKRFPYFSFLRFKQLPLRYAFLKSYKLADRIIFISEYSRNMVEKYLPNIKTKSTIIPLGISEDFLNSKEIYRLPPDLKSSQFYLYVSHLDYYKAQKELVYSWKELIDNGFKSKLVFAGPNVNKYGDEVLSLIKDLNMEKQIIYLGLVDYNMLPSLYESAEALIFASSCECCPNILLEMLSSKKTIYCSNKDPMPEFAEDGAVYFDPYVPSELAAEIFKIDINKELGKELAEKAFELSKKYRSEETIKKNIEYILE